MTLLTICRDAATELGIDSQVNTVIGNPAVDVQRLLRFAGRVCSDLSTRAPWQAMRMMRNFTATATETQTGAVPAGFLYFTTETMWDATNFNFLPGPVSAVEYQSRRNSAYSYSAQGPAQCFTRRGDALLMWPVPNGGETMIFEYQSANYCQSAGGTPQTAWTADTDTARISEELITLGVIARFLSADGQPATQAMADYRERLATEIRNDAPASQVMSAGDVFGGTRHFTGAPGDFSGIDLSRSWGNWYGTWGG